MQKLDLWPGFDDVLGSFIHVFFEIVDEQRSQFCHLLFEVCTASPALGRVQHLVRNARTRFWYIEVEGVVHLVFLLRKLAGMDGIQDGTGILQRTALATRSATCTCPASVEQPSIGVVLRDL